MKGADTTNVIEDVLDTRVDDTIIEGMDMPWINTFKISYLES